MISCSAYNCSNKLNLTQKEVISGGGMGGDGGGGGEKLHITKLMEHVTNKHMHACYLQTQPQSIDVFHQRRITQTNMQNN